MKKRLMYCIIILLTLIAAGSGIFLPGIVLKNKGQDELNKAESAPLEYYSAASSVVARNSSAQLSEFQKLQLISGAWDSRDSEAAQDESLITEYEAVTLAQTALGRLHDAGLYPSTISSDYGNWYSWTADCYKATDTTFNTYTAYYWIISFARYDETESHTVLMTEGGLLLLAVANIKDYKYTPESLNTLYSVLYEKNRSETSVIALSSGDELMDNIPSYPHIELDGMEYSAVSLLMVGRDSVASADKFREYYQNYYQESSSDDMEFYYLFQCEGEDSYAVGIIPYTE
jgi:hypothetical protein